MPIEVVAAEQSATLYVYGGIGMSDQQGYEVLPDEFVAAVQEQTAPELTVRLATVGGDPVAAGAMYQALADYKGAVTTVVDSKAYSAGSMLLQAGDIRSARPLAMIMVHGPRTPLGGTASDMRAKADMLDAHTEMMVGAYTRNGRIGEDVVRGWLQTDKDSYFSAQEALKAGLIDEIDESTDLTASAVPQTYAVAAMATQVETPETETENAVMADTQNTPASPSDADTDVTAILADYNAAQAAGSQTGASNERKRITDILAMKVKPMFADPAVQAVIDVCINDPKIDKHTAFERAVSAVEQLPQSAPINASAASNSDGGVFDASPFTGSDNLGGYQGRAAVGAMHADKVYGAMLEAIEFRMGFGQNVNANANPYTGLSIGELAREFAKEVGMPGVQSADTHRIISALMGPDHRLQIGRGNVFAMHSTGDFPALFANTLNKIIKVRYEQASETWRPCVRMGTVPDFKQASRPALSAFADLLEIPEGSEYKHGTMSDLVEYLTAKKWGRQMSLTREMLINDDLQAMSDLAMAMANSASRKVADEVFAIYTGNPTLNQDTTAVFDATHSNIGTAGAPSVTTLSEARKLMRLQTDPSGNARLNLAPALLITSPVWETEARVLAGSDSLDYELAGDSETSQTVNKNAPNQFGNLMVVVENRLAGDDGTGTSWFVQASPAGSVPFVEVAFVRGQETPEIMSREGWDVDGISYKVRQEFGTAPLAYQPCVFNAGA